MFNLFILELIKSRIRILQKQPIPEKNNIEERIAVQEKLWDKFHVLGFRFSIYPNLKRVNALNIHIIKLKENNNNIVATEYSYNTTRITNCKKELENIQKQLGKTYTLLYLEGTFTAFSYGGQIAKQRR